MQRRKKCLSLGGIFLVTCVVTGLYYIYGMTYAGENHTDNTPPVSTVTQSAVEAPADPLAEDADGHAPGSTAIKTRKLTYDQLAKTQNNWLLLINSDYAMPSVLPAGLANVTDYVPALSNETLMNRDVLIMLKDFFDAAANAGYGEFYVTEGYRTYDYQKSLYDSAENKSLVALPGYSEHEAGLAADISYRGISIGGSKQGVWLMENAYRFGFVERYPESKAPITKIPYEPWHYRYTQTNTDTAGFQLMSVKSRGNRADQQIDNRASLFVVPQVGRRRNCVPDTADVVIGGFKIAVVPVGETPQIIARLAEQFLKTPRIGPRYIPNRLYANGLQYLFARGADKQQFLRRARPDDILIIILRDNGCIIGFRRVATQLTEDIIKGNADTGAQPQ